MFVDRIAMFNFLFWAFWFSWLNVDDEAMLFMLNLKTCPGNPRELCLLCLVVAVWCCMIVNCHIVHDVMLDFASCWFEWARHMLLLYINPKGFWTQKFGTWLALLLFHWELANHNISRVHSKRGVLINETLIYHIAIGQPSLTSLPCYAFMFVPNDHPTCKIHYSFNLTPKFMKFFPSFSHECLLFNHDFCWIFGWLDFKWL